MTEKIKKNPFVEENILISGNNSKKDKIKKTPLIRKSDSDKNDIIIELSHKKSEETNSDDFSGQVLRKEVHNEKAKTDRPIKPVKLSTKAYEKYTQRLKEKTMRIEIEKIQKETERIKQIYDEKNSFLHIFDNNPQFQKILKMVEKQLILIFIQAIVVCIFSSLIYFYITKKKQGLALSIFSLSIAEIAIFIILIFSLKIGLLNDPELSKAFRLFVIIELFLIVSSFVINVIAPFVINEHLKKLNDNKIKIIIYILFFLIIVLFIITFKFCFVLFAESTLILLNKKTEYSILMINEKNTRNEINIDNNLSTSLNNISTQVLNTTSNDIFDNNSKKSNSLITKEEEEYRNYNYFKRFHYSVTSERKEEKYIKRKKI